LRHPIGFKKRMVQRMVGPEGISATALSREVGVPQQTLSRWLREARSLERMSKSKHGGGEPRARRPEDWTPEEKLRVVLEAARVTDGELGAFLRERGLHAADLESWREVALAALGAGSRRGSRRRTPETRRIRQLEKELLRKDRALAEVTALLALKKKLAALWGDEGDDIGTRRGT